MQGARVNKNAVDTMQGMSLLTTEVILTQTFTNLHGLPLQINVANRNVANGILVGRSPTVPDGRSGSKPIWDLF